MSKDNLPEKISPEGVKIANRYLESSCNTADTAASLAMSKHEVQEVLNTQHVKKYVDSILSEAGFRQMGKVDQLMDELIELKMAELQEADMGSSKDIAELLAMSHKFAQERIKLVIERNKDAAKVNKTTNVQNNIYDGASNYGKLMEAIAKGSTI
jgi:hypothetical protein